MGRHGGSSQPRRRGQSLCQLMAADRNPATLAKHYTLKCNEVDHISGEP